MAASATQGRILGLGGLFFKSPDPTRLREWYRRVLDLQFTSWGGVEFDPATLPENGRLVFTVLAADTDYFRPGEQPFMVKLIVDELDAVVVRAVAAGAAVLEERASGENGDFAWLIDCEGNKVELWQPPAAGRA